MKDYVFDIHVSKLKSVLEKSPFNVGLHQYMTQLKDHSNGYKKSKDCELEDFKKSLSAYMLAGTFKGREKEDINIISGLLPLDLDMKDPDKSDKEFDSLIDMIKYKATLLNVRPIIIHKTVSEQGLRLIYYSSKLTPETYESKIKKLAAYIENQLDIELDHKCFNLNRLWFTAYDPEAFVSEELIDISDQLDQFEQSPIEQHRERIESNASFFKREMQAYLDEHCYDGNKHEAIRLAAVQASSYVVEKIEKLSNARDYLINYIRKIPNIKNLDDAIRAIDKGFDYGLHQYNTKKKSRGIQKAEKELLHYNYEKENKFRKANDRLDDASKLPPSRKLMDTLVFENELTIFFADTGVGKSAFIVAWADAITRGKSFLELECELKSPIVQIIDFELSDVQFRKRYSSEGIGSYKFSDNLFIDSIPLPSDGFDTEEYVDAVIASIKNTLTRIKPNILVIDNISYISNQNPKEGPVAAGLLKKFRELRDEFSLTIIVIAHTPKIDTRIRLNLNHLSGSKQFSNLSDAVFALGKSSAEEGLRYIKQLKIRSDINRYEKEVLVCRLTKTDNLLGYLRIDMDDEGKHLSQDEDPRMKEAIELRQGGESVRDIADKLNISKSTVDRWTRRGLPREKKPSIH